MKQPTDQQKLTHPTHLAKQFHLDRQTVARVLKQSRVKPVTSIKYGRGSMHMYDEEAATAAVIRHVEKARAKGATAVPPPPAPVVSLSGIEAQLAQLTKALGDQADAITALTEAVKATHEQCTQQNKVLLQAMQKSTSNLSLVLEQLGVKPA
jgi:hypothetical protein